MRKVVVAIVIVAIVGGLALVFATQRPELNKARNATVTQWEPLIQPLNARYSALASPTFVVESQLRLNGEDNQLIDQMKVTNAAWQAVSKGDDPKRMVEVANTIESQVGQLRAVLSGSTRLTQSSDVIAAQQAFDAKAPPALNVTAYNLVVKAYEKKRTSGIGRPVAKLLGYEPVPTFEPSLAPGQP